MVYWIGSFNCHRMGAASAAAKDLALIARIINGEGFDVVALQEIHGPGALQMLLNALNRERLRGAEWVGEVDTEVSEYGFVWNKNKLRKVETKLAGGGKRVYQPTIYKQYRLDRSLGQKKFVRNPYYARFEPCHPAPQNIEFRLINTHIRFSKGKDGEEDNSPGAIAMRKNEFIVLTQALFPAIEDKPYGKNNVAYTILLGDYNLNLDLVYTHSPYLPQEEVHVQDGKSEKRLRTTQAQLTTLKKNWPGKWDTDIPGKVPPGDEPLANNYDHCTYNRLKIAELRPGEERATPEGVHITVERVDVLGKYIKPDGAAVNPYGAYLKDVSDHLPIKIELTKE